MLQKCIDKWENKVYNLYVYIPNNSNCIQKQYIIALFGKIFIFGNAAILQKKILIKGRDFIMKFRKSLAMLLSGIIASGTLVFAAQAAETDVWDGTRPLKKSHFLD